MNVLKHSWKFGLILLLMGLLLSACAPATTDDDPADDGDTPASSEDPNAPLTDGPDGVGQVYVDDIEIAIAESFPVQVFVNIRGNLADGCTSLASTETDLVEDRFIVYLNAVRPADAVCTEALVPFEENVSLPVAGLPAGNYSVDVEGVTGSFTLDMDNSLPEDESADGYPAPESGQDQSQSSGAYPAPGETDRGGLGDGQPFIDGEFMVSRAPIMDLSVEIDSDNPSEALVTMMGALNDGCTTIRDISVEREDNVFYVTVTTQRPQDQMCTQVVTNFEETLTLDLSELPRGTYEVDVNSMRVEFDVNS